MEHLLVKAATTAATDQGTFEAVISTASIDRVGDIVEPTAIVAALQKWAALGKKMPLAYSHRDPTTGHAVVVGHIDPASARIQGKEVITKGWVDQSTERGAEAWRLVKSGTLSFSYGYLVPEGGQIKRAGGHGFHITKIDLYEISVVPVAPANNDTRILSYKALDDLKARTAKLEREIEEDRLPDVKQMDDETDDTVEDPMQAIHDAIEELQEFIDQERAEGDPADVAAAQRLLEGLQKLMQAEMADDMGKAVPDADRQRHKAATLEREHEHEKNVERRAAEEQNLPDLGPQPPEPEPEPKPEPPAVKPQRQKAETVMLSFERERKQQQRATEEQSLPDVPPPPPPPAPEPPPVIPDGKHQRRKAQTLEREQKRQERKAEEQALPNLGPQPPEPPPQPKPEPPTPPDTVQQRTKAVAIAQEQKQHERHVEEQGLPDLGPPPPDPPLPPDPPTPPDADELRRKVAAIEREENDKRVPDMPDPKPQNAVLHITHEEMAGLAEGQLKAVWSASFVNDLADSAFLYIEPGGDRDTDGKTVPRTNRHFPYKDASGAVDLPHLRNALARIPQSNSPVRQRSLTAKAQRILDGQKSVPVDVTDQEAQGLRSADPLRARAQAVELEFASGGESRRKPPAQKDAPKPRPELALDELRQRTRDETLIALSGVDEL